MTTIDELVTSPVQTIIVTCAAYLGEDEVATLDVAGGSVTADARRSQMRDGSIELAPSAEMDLREMYELLSTPGLEISLRRGFRLPDESDLTVPLGRFIVDEVSYSSSASGERLSATLTDLSTRIARARWSDPYQVVSGTALAEALNDILLDRWHGVRSAITTDNCPDTMATGCIFEAGSESDPWSDACSIAEAYGYALFFDADGFASVRTIPDPASEPPRFAFRRGSTAIVTDETHVMPMEQIRNGVIASAEGSEIETPVRGEAWDDDPASPTYRNGPFGMVPRFYSSPLLTTQGMCETAAESMLRMMLGRSETLSWQHVVHPGLVPLDVVAIEDEDGVGHRYVIDSLTIPLDIGSAMTAKARDAYSEEEL